jgi:hypothetical protein
VGRPTGDAFNSLGVSTPACEVGILGHKRRSSDVEKRCATFGGLIGRECAEGNITSG